MLYYLFEIFIPYQSTFRIFGIIQKKEKSIIKNSGSNSISMGSSPTLVPQTSNTIPALTSYQLSIGQNIRFAQPQQLSPNQHTFILQTCRKLSFIGDLPEDRIQNIVLKFRKCYSTQQWMFKEGSKATYFFIIAEGRVQIVKNGYLIRALQVAQYFGEMALLYGIKRSSFVRVPKQYRTKNLYYALHRTDFLEAVRYINPQKTYQFLSLIQPSPHYSYLTYRDRTLLAQKSIKIKFKAQERILTKFDEPYALFVISKGTIKLSFPNKRQIDIGPKNCFGYFGNSWIWCSVVSVTEAVVYAVGKNAVDGVLRKKIKFMNLWNKVRFILLNSTYLTQLSAQRIQQLTNLFTFTFTQKYKPLCFSNTQIQKILIPLTCYNQYETQQKPTSINGYGLQNISTPITFHEGLEPLGLQQMMSGKRKYKNDYVCEKMGHFAQIDADMFMKFVEDQGFRDSKNGSGFLWGRDCQEQNIGNKELQIAICKQNRFNLSYVLQKANPRNKQQSDALVLEHQLMKQLPCPFLQSFYFFIETPTYQHLGKQLIKGVPLSAYVSNIGVIPHLISRLYIACIVLALEFMHARGIVCQSIGIENCLIGEDGWLWIQGIKLCQLKPQNQKEISQTILTKYQNSSSQYKNIRDLGLISYQLLVGKPLSSLKHMKTKDAIYIPSTLKNIEARQFLNTLLTQKQVSCRKIKQLNYFKGVDWQALNNKQLEAPIIPGFMSLYSAF